MRAVILLLATGAIAVGCNEPQAAHFTQKSEPNVMVRQQRLELDMSEELQTDRAPGLSEGIRHASVSEPISAVKEPPKQQRVRRLRRFPWESPVATRSKLWNVPRTHSDDATLTAFLRVCMAEASGHAPDCIGIWQVIRNNRRRTCSRSGPGGDRITECEEGGGETYLSALRRHQRHVLGYLPIHNKRALWIGKMTLDCDDPPSNYPHSLNHWDGWYQKRCQDTVALGRHLLAGRLPPSVPGHRMRWLPGRPITWGGRCETGTAACDDRLACARGLIRIPDTGTHNAFWRRPEKPGETDPVCTALGYGAQQQAADLGVTGVQAAGGSNERLTGQALQARPVLNEG